MACCVRHDETMLTSVPISAVRKKEESPPSFTRGRNKMDPVYALWDEMDTISAGNSDEALSTLSLRLSQLLNADNVRWLGAVRVLHDRSARRDRLRGWRLRASYDMMPDSGERFQQKGEPGDDFQVGLATEALIAGVGQFRVHRMRDGWINFREFRKSEHFDLHYEKLGITDRMWVSFPLNADTESIFLIDRKCDRPHFLALDASLARAILRGMRGFHHRLLLSRGLIVGNTPLSPVARRIVQGLLTGMSEKEIAVSVNQCVGTTHKYIKTIYTCFAVNSRAALMALWLSM